MASPQRIMQWDAYWAKQRGAVFGWLSNLFRYLFLAGPIARMFEKYFPAEGTFMEAGSGSASDTVFLDKKRRRLIAFDCSAQALKFAGAQKNIDETLQGDLLDWKIAPESLDGIWNLGVMEHFSHEDIDAILGNFRSALKENGRVILLWPSWWNIVNFFVGFLFPPMPSILQSRRQAREILDRNGFKTLEVAWTIVGDYIVVAQRA